MTQYILGEALLAKAKSELVGRLQQKLPELEEVFIDEIAEGMFLSAFHSAVEYHKQNVRHPKNVKYLNQARELKELCKKLGLHDSEKITILRDFIAERIAINHRAILTKVLMVNEGQTRSTVEKILRACFEI